MGLSTQHSLQTGFDDIESGDLSCGFRQLGPDGAQRCLDLHPTSVAGVGLSTHISCSCKNYESSKFSLVSYYS